MEDAPPPPSEPKPDGYARDDTLPPPKESRFCKTEVDLAFAAQTHPQVPALDLAPTLSPEVEETAQLAALAFAVASTLVAKELVAKAQKQELPRAKASPQGAKRRVSTPLRAMAQSPHKCQKHLHSEADSEVSPPCATFATDKPGAFRFQHGKTPWGFACNPAQSAGMEALEAFGKWSEK